jgi:hypothetical protein
MKILNNRFVPSSETDVRNGMKSWKAPVLSSAQRQEATGALFISAIRELGLQLCSQSWNLTISDGTIDEISSNASPCLTVRFSAVMIGIFDLK